MCLPTTMMYTSAVAEIPKPLYVVKRVTENHHETAVAHMETAASLVNNRIDIAVASTGTTSVRASMCVLTHLSLSFRLRCIFLGVRLVRCTAFS